MKLALGTAQFGSAYGIANSSGQVTTEEARQILLCGHIAGMDTVDTSVTYGESEAVLGAVGLSGWRVITKLPAVPAAACPGAWMRKTTEGSLRRLRVDKLYALLLHRPEQLLTQAGDELYSALEALKFTGLVEKIGVSAYDPGELPVLFDRYEFDIVQAPLSPFNRQLVESGWAARLRSNGVEVHARSIFLQGLLLMRPEDRPPAFSRWRRVWEAWDHWLERTGRSALDVCVSYVLAVPEVSRIFVGVDSLCQLESIVAVAGAPVGELPPELQSIEAGLMDPRTWQSP